MKRFYLSGQRSFANRGCEAIVRSTVSLLNQAFEQAKILVPSDNQARDSAQWPDAAQKGVQFVPAYFPFWSRYWVNLQRLPFPFLKKAGWPFMMPQYIRKTFSQVDAVLSVGGDNYSLDYRLPSPLMGLDGWAMDTDKPVVLWGASVGPFEAEPIFVPIIQKHLSRMRLIAVRESVSESYLGGSLGLKNVLRMADPAFTLIPQKTDLQRFWPDPADSGVLGLNFSPLIERYRKDQDNLISEIARFITFIVHKRNLSILLVPHVNELKNNDAAYMQAVLQRTGTMHNRVRMMDAGLNAAQIKYVIAHCRYFIGARTHSTIAALSSGVPTVSIAYSIKAKGINQDLFGHLDYVLETPQIRAASLQDKMMLLIARENAIQSHLKHKMERVHQDIGAGVRRLKEIICASGRAGN